jgi:NTE family protein
MLCTCCPLATRPLRTPLSILLRSFLIALDAKYGCDVAHYRRQGLSIRAVEPHFPVDIGLLDFRHTEALIRTGYEQTLAALGSAARDTKPVSPATAQATA